jgi:hypothetical protein
MYPLDQQMMRNDAIDRWFKFPYAWSSSIVEAALAVINLDSVGVLWDPFVGSGTTALIGALRGIATICCDIDPLATLITSLKLDPPRASEIEWARGIINTLNFDTDIENLASTLDNADKRRADILRFFIIVPLLRAQWHEGVLCDSHGFKFHLENLIEEILEDSPQMLGLRPINLIACMDFYSSAKLVSERGSTPVVLITSPPFPTSNVNPDIEQLANLVGLKRPQEELVSACLRLLECAPTELTSITSVVEAYKSILRTIVGTAIQVGCQSVILEIATLKPIKVGPFVESIREQLREHKYVVKQTFDASTPLEDITVLSAVVG